MSNFTRVYFPGLGIDFDLPSVAFTIGSYDIHFYGIIIAFGFMLAVLYGGRMAYKWRMSLDGMTDVLIWGTVFGIVCARAYYVIFEWSYYSAHPAEIVQIWNGGLAIYGGLIGGIIAPPSAARWARLTFAICWTWVPWVCLSARVSAAGAISLTRRPLAPIRIPRSLECGA